MWAHLSLLESQNWATHVLFPCEVLLFFVVVNYKSIRFIYSNLKPILPFLIFFSGYSIENVSLLTSIFKLLCPTVLTFALVRASGSSQAKHSCCTKSWSGILIPTRRVVGFNPGFNSSVLSNTRVTGPGSKSWRASRLMVTFPHLKTLVRDNTVTP